jgi:hypothetical protein
VQCVLDAGAVEQFVTVEWAEPTFLSSTTPVVGASVSIEKPDGSIEQAVGASGTGVPPFVVYRFMRDSLLQPEGTYTLRVRTPTGEEATGTTTIPLVSTAPVGLEILPTLDRERDTVRLAWPRVAGAKSYQVAVRGRDPQNFFIVSTFTQFVDTSATIAGTARTFENDEVFPRGSIVNIVVVDENYYDYYHPTVDPFAGAPPSKLTGAIGVFGSIAPVKMRRYSDVR